MVEVRQRRRAPQSPAYYAGRLLIYALLLLGIVMYAFPLVWMIFTALKDNTEIMRMPPSLLPEAWKWSNFPNALKEFPFFLYLRNTLFIVAFQMLGNVSSAAIVGYSFARLRWPGRDIWFVVLLSTMMLPGVVTMVPTFIMFKNFGWMNTYLPFIVPTFCGSAFNIFLMRQFFRGIPMDLSESARLDGAGEFITFARIILPLCKPALATIAIFSFMGCWNDYMGPLLYLNDASKFTITYGLRSFQLEHDTDWPYLMAAATIISLPTVMLFFFCQRYFIEGITLTGMKG